MVNSAIVHPNPYVRLRPDLPWPPPSSSEGQSASRIIKDRVWLLQDFIDVAQRCLAGTEGLIHAVTKVCQEDMSANFLQYPDVAEIICLLTDDDYENSQWCQRSARQGVKCAPEAVWLPCDAYVISIASEDEYEEPITYYIKMCRGTGANVLLLLSTHPARF